MLYLFVHVHIKSFLENCLLLFAVHVYAYVYAYASCLWSQLTQFLCDIYKAFR